MVGVSLSAAMHSLILMDQNNQPLTRVVTWADNRSEKVSAALQQNGMAQELYRQTGTPNHPMTPLTKIMWFRQERPDLFAQATKFIGIKDYVLYRLFGRYVMDYGLASATGLLNLQTLDWDQQALKIAGITKAQLPELVDTETQLTGLSESNAKLLGLKSDVPFIIGSSDGALANLGVDAITPGKLAVSIGTSGAVRMVVDHPVFDPQGKLFCYVLGKGRWLVGGPVNNGGIILRWVRDQWFSGDKKPTYPELMQMAAKSVSGAHGLVFLPYLGGERAPIWDANARGIFFGLTRQHTQADMVRAVLEGIVLNLCEVAQRIDQVAGPIKSIQATGGFSEADLWIQILTDCFDQPVTVPDNHEGSALGAAVMGMHSLGLVSDLTEIHRLVSDSKQWQPNKKRAQRYHEFMKIWLETSQLVEPEYAKIAAFQQKYSK
ncbi:gluconokinase [Pediococcus damnosus]